ncbi:MAG: flavoprotein [Dermatophilaceae bacterium]
MNENDFHLPERPRILVGATGSIAVSSLPQYLDAMRAAFGGTYTVVMTHTATTFLPPHVAQLSAEHVVAGEQPADWPTDRPSRLAADHDAIVVLPATAHTLSAVATGAAPNRLTTVVLSAAFRSVFVPHMGPHMWTSPAVTRNVAQLRADGHRVVEPVWHDSRDVATGELISHPAVPEPDVVTAALREIYG